MISSMLSDLSMIFLNRIGENDVELLYDIDPKLPKTLIGDTIRIRQIITNIANNAIKFTEKGYVKLTLIVDDATAPDGDPDKLHLIFSVTDTGQGIKKEDLGRLFKSFSQVDSKKNRKKEGTGLGLAISKSLVERMGGQISVESEYGKGSVFTFDIWQQKDTEKPAAKVKDENKGEVVSGIFASEPALLGIDIKEGIKNSGSAALFKEFLGDYAKLIVLKTEKINDCLSNDDIKDYTIEVHALKSTSRTIGAMELGKKFWHLEQAGNANDKETIISETQKVLKEYNGFKEILAPFVIKEPEGDKKDASKTEIIEILDRLKKCADEFDIDGADAALKELEGIKLPDEIKGRMDKLSALVADVAADEIMEEVDSMKSAL